MSTLPPRIERRCAACPSEVAPGYLRHYREAHANVIEDTKRRIIEFVPRDTTKTYDLYSMLKHIEQDRETIGKGGHLLCTVVQAIPIVVCEMYPTTALALIDLTTLDDNYHLTLFSTPLEYMVTAEVVRTGVEPMFMSDIMNPLRRIPILKSEKKHRKERYCCPLLFQTSMRADPHEMRMYMKNGDGDESRENTVVCFRVLPAAQ